MTAPIPSNDFLRGLAQRLDLTGLVYVPAAATGTTQILAPSPDRLDRLQQAGRDWLAGSGESVRTEDVHVAPVRSAAGQLAGVVVAEHETRRGWSDRDDAVLTFCVEACADDLSAGLHRTGEDDLRRALDHDELFLLYQPEFDLANRRMVAAEALIRWRHPQRGELEPDDFIPQAEQSGIIRPIGDWVIRTAISTLAQWRRARPNLNLRMRINISPVQLTDAGVYDRLAAALREYDVPGSQLGIELTEQAPSHDLQEVAEILRRLKQLGVTSAIDDLATGYSTLSRLRNLTVDMIKIDRSLVTGIDTDARAQSIVTAMIGLAMNFGLDVVAEGVQNEDEVATLLALGCTRAQGHYLSRPLPAEAVLELTA